MKTPASGESRCSLKVLILGGYGAMAQSTVPDLLASPGVERVGIAGRSAAKAESFAAAQRDDRATAVPAHAPDSAALAGGGAGKFVPPYAIRTIFDEFSLDAPILRKGKIQFVPALSGLERSEFMSPVGVVEGYYTIHSELATMPKTIGKGIQEMDFIVAFPPGFRETIATIVRLGLASRSETVVDGLRVRPYDVTSTVIDALSKPKEPELDVDIH